MKINQITLSNYHPKTAVLKYYKRLHKDRFKFHR